MRLCYYKLVTESNNHQHPFWPTTEDKDAEGEEEGSGLKLTPDARGDGLHHVGLLSQTDARRS